MIATPIKSNNQAEPTLSDVVTDIADLRDTVTDLSGTVTNLSETVTGLSETVTSLSVTVTNLSETMKSGFEHVDALLESLYTANVDHFKLTQDIQRRVVNLERQSGDIQDSLSNLEEAEAKDAIASINHEERIVRLEKINNIQAVSPHHLAEIE